MATQISSLTTLNNNTGSYNCFIPIVDTNLPLNSRNVKIRISTHNEMFSNNFAVGNLSSYANYFGTGTDGSVTVSSSVQISSSTSPAGLNNISREFGDSIVKNFQNLTINSGVFFSPLRACRGMLIYCTGDLTVNGTISMTGKGGGVGSKIASPIGFAPVTDTRFDLIDATLYFNNFSSSAAGGRGIPTHWNWAPSGSVWFNNYKIRIPLSGSVAGGTAGIFCCGGGGTGGDSGGGAGGRGTIFAGGGGGGGTFATAGLFERGGVGGSSPFATGGGGAGNPAGAPNGGVGVGGLLIIIVRGNVTVNGTISNNGINGGPPSAAPGGSGGGSGGGRTIIVYGGTYTNVGTVVANGGTSGAGNAGAGAITVRKIHI